MSSKSFFCATETFIYIRVISGSGSAGLLFAPNNIGPDPNGACPYGEVLSWESDHVDCVNPTPGVTVARADGQELTGISSGTPVCRATSFRLKTTLQDVKDNCDYPKDPGPATYNQVQFQMTCASRYCANVYGTTWGMLTGAGPGYNDNQPWDADPNTNVRIVSGT